MKHQCGHFCRLLLQYLHGHVDPMNPSTQHQARRAHEVTFFFV